jgi:hypothetical protein
MSNSKLETLLTLYLCIILSLSILHQFGYGQINEVGNSVNQNYTVVVFTPNNNNNNMTAGSSSNTTGIMENTSGMVDDAFGLLKDTFGSFFEK